MDQTPADARLRPAAYPARDLALATYLTRLHAATRHHISASECETLKLADLLAHADAEDAARWERLTMAYTHPIGPHWLRAAACGGYVGCAADDLVCFAGAQEALFATLHALLRPGDHAIVVLPSYQSMETLARGLCAVTGVALDATRGWSLEIERIEAAVRPNTRAIIISFPNNPTGKQLERDRFDALVGLCRLHGIWLLSDEVYRLTERDPADRLPNAADAYERGVSLGGLSKAYGLPGLRIAWVACRDPGLVQALATMRQYLSSCSAAPSEVLACIALKAAEPILARNRGIAEANLALLAGFFERHPDLFKWREPDGGVVCYPSYRGGEGVETFVARAARDASVLLLPASVFVSDLLELPVAHLRFGFGRSGLAEGLAALEQIVR